MLEARVIDRGELTAREAEIFARVIEGAPDKVIANELGIALKTVGAHLDKVYLKLEVRSASVNARCAAIGTAIARGMVSVSTKALCLVLALAAADWDDEALVRHTRARLPKVRVVQIGHREA